MQEWGGTQEGGGAGRRSLSQPHQLQPLFEFNEWILASEARAAETSTRPPHSTLPPIPKSSPLPEPLSSLGPI